jgi:hypothetical protein
LDYLINISQVERALKAWETGVFVEPSRFSLDNVGQLVAEYVFCAQKLDDGDWNNIYKLCGLGPRRTSTAISDEPELLLSTNRCALVARRNRS